MYTLFYLFEEIIRKILTAKSFNKDTILYRIISSEDVLLQWSLLSASVDENTGTIILLKIANMYLTIHGFAFVSSA